MSKKTSYLLGIALTIILGTFLYQKFCCNCAMEIPSGTTEKVVPIEQGISNLVPFNIRGSGIDYHCNDNLKFLTGSSNTIVPVSDSVSIGIEKLKTYLSINPNQRVLITGYATSTEKNTSTFPNLGFARAEDVKNYFVSKGMFAKQFDTDGILKDSWKMDADTLLGPVAFELRQTAVATGDEWAVLKEKINASPLILYFNTNKSNNKLDAEERQKVADIANYTSHITDATVLAVGHTDNVGNPESNRTLGQHRADFAKSYLAKNGIESNRIETTTKGSDEPIADNTTLDGKAKNRRTVITIK